jgi:hypothetical protein
LTRKINLRLEVKMDVISYIQTQFIGLRDRQAAVTLAGITDEQLNRIPPDGANKIGAILLHAIQSEDLFIQKFFQDKPLVWESQCWSDTIGIPDPPSGDIGWDEARQADLKLAPILTYHQAVCAETDAYLSCLTPEALDREVPFFGYQVPLAYLLINLTAHIAEHLGEIAALKGILEIKN